MASYVKYEKYIEFLCNKEIDAFGTTDTYKIILSNTAPNVATHTVLADASDLSTSGGYTAGGQDTQNDSTRSGGTVTETAVDVLWTATTGFGPFRYVIRYDDTHASDALINYWDYASSISLAALETFTADFGASTATFA